MTKAFGPITFFYQHTSGTSNDIYRRATYVVPGMMSTIVLQLQFTTLLDKAYSE